MDDRQVRMRQEEHYNQVAVVRWAALQAKRYPGLELLYAIPNGGRRHIGVARKLKGEGVKAGVPDLFLPVPRGTFHGLFIEMKSSTGSLTPEQRAWLTALSKQGYKAALCKSAQSAIDVITIYMESGK